MQGEGGREASVQMAGDLPRTRGLSRSMPFFFLSSSFLFFLFFLLSADCTLSSAACLFFFFTLPSTNTKGPSRICNLPLAVVVVHTQPQHTLVSMQQLDCLLASIHVCYSQITTVSQHMLLLHLIRKLPKVS